MSQYSPRYTLEHVHKRFDTNPKSEDKMNVKPEPDLITDVSSPTSTPIPIPRFYFKERGRNAMSRLPVGSVDSNRSFDGEDRGDMGSLDSVDLDMEDTPRVDRPRVDDLVFTKADVTKSDFTRSDAGESTMKQSLLSIDHKSEYRHRLGESPLFDKSAKLDDSIKRRDLIKLGESLEDSRVTGPLDFGRSVSIDGKREDLSRLTVSTVSTRRESKSVIKGPEKKVLKFPTAEYHIDCSKESVNGLNKYQRMTINRVYTKQMNAKGVMEDVNISKEFVLVFDPEYYRNIPTDFKSYERIKQLVFLLTTEKILYTFRNDDPHHVLQLDIIYRISNKKCELSLFFLDIDVYNMYLEYTYLAKYLFTNKGDFIKQNSFEICRLKLKSIKNLGYYDYLKEKVDDAHEAFYTREPEKNCCRCVVS